MLLSNIVSSCIMKTTCFSFDSARGIISYKQHRGSFAIIHRKQNDAQVETVNRFLQSIGPPSTFIIPESVVAT